MTVAAAQPLMGAPTVAGPPIGVRDSLQLVDAWAVVSTIARTAAAMPPVVYRPVGAGRERVTGTVGADVLRRPSPSMTRSAFVASAVMTVAMWGEVFVCKFRRPDGALDGLGLLAPDAVEVALEPNGQPTYVTTLAGQRRRLTRADVAHGMLLSLDGLRGVSPVRQAREALGLNRALGRQASATVANDGTPRGLLSIPPGPMGEEALKRLDAAWGDRHRGPERSGRIAVVSGDVSFSPVGLPPGDQEFLEQRRLSTLETCRIWGCPPWAVGATSGDSMTYSNVESQQLALVRNCVMSYVRPLEEALSDDDEIAPGDQYVELLAEGVLRGDTTSRYAAYQTGISAGFLLPEEVRERESLPPLPSSPPPRSTPGGDDA